MKVAAITLSTIGLLAFAASGCSESTQEEQQGAGYFSTAGAPLIQNTGGGAPGEGPDRASMRGVLVASNPTVYSNRLFMTRPNLYQVTSESMSGATAPPANPGAVVAREHAVFFDFGQAALTPQGRQIVDEVATAVRGDGTLQIVLVGKADRSGTDAYNMALSQRRADAVRRQLVSDGVAADRVDARWVGEREPSVPTADGVREPRNRVVDVTLVKMSGGTTPASGTGVGAGRVLFTTTEPFPPGADGQELPGSPATGSVMGATGL